MPRGASAGAWPTAPIARGTGPLPPRPSSPPATSDSEQLNASNPERRLIAGVSLVAIMVCLPAFIALVATMPNTDVLTSPPPPPAAPRVVTLPDPVLPLPDAPKAAPAVVATTPAPAPAAAPANKASAPAPAPARASKAAPVQHAPAVVVASEDPPEKKAHAGKRHTKKQPVPLDIEIWPPQRADPMDSRLAAPPAAADEEDGPGEGLKRPAF
jgi:hypothetical protein